MNRQSNLEYLSNHEFFSSLNDEMLQYLNECSSTHEIKKGQILFLQGETADKFYIVLKGHISIQVPAIIGPILEIQELGQDNVLGWSWLISPYKWSFQAKAVEDSTLLMFDGKAILNRCEQDPKFGYELLKKFAELMSVRLEAARKRIMDEWNPEGFA